MRWFKHDTDARNDVRLKLLKKRFGAEGYGVYFQLLEIIGEYIEKDNFDEWGMVDKYHTVETLAEECGVTPERLREVLQCSNELGLFEKKDHRLYCEKITNRLDDYAERVKANTEKSTKKVPTKSLHTTDNVGRKSDIEEIRIDKNRIEKKRIDNTTPIGVAKSEPKREYGDPTINEAIVYFKERFGLPILDGSVQQNRNYCQLAIKKFGGLDKLKLLIAAAAHHEFWKTKVTSFQMLYNKGVQIISDTRSGTGYGIDASGG